MLDANKKLDIVFAYGLDDPNYQPEKLDNIRYDRDYVTIEVRLTPEAVHEIAQLHHSYRSHIEYSFGQKLKIVALYIWEQGRFDCPASGRIDNAAVNIPFTITVPKLHDFYHVFIYIDGRLV